MLTSPRRLGAIDVSRLRRTQIENWFHGLAEQGKGIRVKKGEDAKFRPLRRRPPRKRDVGAPPQIGA